MARNLIALVVPLLGLGVACAPKASCDTIAAKNKECADALVAQTQARAELAFQDELSAMSVDQQNQARQRMAARFAQTRGVVKASFTDDSFRADCQTSWNDEAKTPAALKLDLSRCLAKPSCDDYAACFMKAAREHQVRPAASAPRVDKTASGGSVP